MGEPLEAHSLHSLHAATHIGNQLAPLRQSDSVDQGLEAGQHIMYKPSRIYFRRQEACDSLALDFSNMDGSSVGEEESSKEVRWVDSGDEGETAEGVTQRERDTIPEEILTRICSFPSIIGCSLYLIKYSYLSPEPIRLTGQRGAAGLDWFLRNAAILLS